MRCERDAISELNEPTSAYYGIHTLRAAHNFPFSGQQLYPAFIRAYAQVKRVCAMTNTDLGYLSKKRGDAIATAYMEVESGKLNDEIIVDPFQGGSGSSTNMNFNEVNATKGLVIKCIPGIKSNQGRCLDNVEQDVALATVLVPALGYDRVDTLLTEAKASKRTIREEILFQKLASPEVIDGLLSPKRLCKLGFTPDEFREVKNTWK